MTETKQIVLASHFEECARMLRKHPQLFDAPALAHVEIFAGLAVRATRLAAKKASTLDIVREIGTALFTALARLVLRRPFDRNVILLLAGARRGYLAAIETATTLELRRHPKVTLIVDDPRGPMLSSACPRCGRVDTRSLERPEPCSCGFVFLSLDPENPS